MTNPIRQSQPRPSGLNAVQRYTVRVVLLTGAMIAALIGAQAMAVIDKSALSATAATPVSTAAITVTPAAPAIVSTKAPPKATRVKARTATPTAQP